MQEAGLNDQPVRRQIQISTESANVAVHCTGLQRSQPHAISLAFSNAARSICLSVRVLAVPVGRTLFDLRLVPERSGSRRQRRRRSTVALGWLHERSLAMRIRTVILGETHRTTHDDDSGGDRPTGGRMEKNKGRRGDSPTVMALTLVELLAAAVDVPLRRRAIDRGVAVSARVGAAAGGVGRRPRKKEKKTERRDPAETPSVAGCQRRCQASALDCSNGTQDKPRQRLG